jgi:hypothetical protein
LILMDNISGFLRPEQRAYIVDFIVRWNAAEKGQ